MSHLYFSPSTKGFYSSLVSGVRFLTTVDPAWTPPLKVIQDPDWVAPEDQPDAPHPLMEVPDYDAVGPMVTIPNPDCKIPADAVEITEEQQAVLLLGEQAGQMIDADADGHPVLVARPKPTPTPAMIAHLRFAVQSKLDDLALSCGFDSMGDAVSYIHSEDPDAQQKARTLSAYRDACRAFTGPEYADMLASNKDIPEVDAFIASLPAVPVLA
jgi:hypothetical protein